MPPFVLQQDCDNPSHLVTRLGGAYETGMTADSHLVVFYDRATPLNVTKRGIRQKFEQDCHESGPRLVF
jgi:hypothetical protein